MNIIFTKTFKKDFWKIFKWNNNLLIFKSEIKKTKLINLNKTYKKYKFCIITNSVRGIVQEYKENFYIPLLIVKKSDKNYWMNLILNSEIEKILEIKSQKAEKDIENDNFEIF